MNSSISAFLVFFFALIYPGVSHANADAVAQNPVDALLTESRELLQSTPEKASQPFSKLQALQGTFTATQNQRYHALYAKYLGFQGRHEERIQWVQSIIGQVKAPAVRVSLLYDLVDANRALGHYENALQAMNESILLLPSITDINAKIAVLDGAVSLLTTMRAFDEALSLSERIIALDSSSAGGRAQCHGLANKIELNFKLGNSHLARSLVPQTVSACDASKEQMASLLVKSFAAIDLVDTAQYASGIANSLPLVQQFQVIGTSSTWLAALEEALARAYLQTNHMDLAERYGTQAYKLAVSAKDLYWQEKTSETLATIKNTQGHLATAIGYFKTNLALKKELLDDQQQKSLAYQRVKFETQDKANQLAMLEQKNKNLNTERALQKNKYQNLILLLTLGLVALAILGVWSVKTLRQRNVFRTTSQIDGLTQVSNRTHFTACCHLAYLDTRKNMGLMLFDMDFFKHVNDAYGHATGDWVLKNVCATVSPLLSKADTMGRLGGEEFAICMPGAGIDETRELAERCRLAIAAIDTQPSGFAFSLTASFGVATRQAGEATSYEETLVAADKALYLSKNEGRDRVTVYQHSPRDHA
jgi:diguanylate cyclase (GGDEF)-like protein